MSAADSIRFGHLAIWSIWHFGTLALWHFGHLVDLAIWPFGMGRPKVLAAQIFDLERGGPQVSGGQKLYQIFGRPKLSVAQTFDLG